MELKVMANAACLSDAALAELVDSMKTALKRGRESREWRNLMRGWTFTEEEPYQLKFID